jgi:hypothetical protein
MMRITSTSMISTGMALSRIHIATNMRHSSTNMLIFLIFITDILILERDD